MPGHNAKLYDLPTWTAVCDRRHFHNQRTLTFFKLCQVFLFRRYYVDHTWNLSWFQYSLLSIFFIYYHYYNTTISYTIDFTSENLELVKLWFGRSFTFVLPLSLATWLRFINLTLLDNMVPILCRCRSSYEYVNYSASDFLWQLNVSRIRLDEAIAIGTHMTTYPFQLSVICLMFDSIYSTIFIITASVSRIYILLQDYYQTLSDVSSILTKSSVFTY